MTGLLLCFRSALVRGGLPYEVFTGRDCYMQWWSCTYGAIAQWGRFSVFPKYVCLVEIIPVLFYYLCKNERNDVMLKLYQSPEVPSLLLLYDALLPRMHLSSQEKQKREQIFKGFVGESLFKELLPKNGLEKVIPLFDLRLEANEAEFQIDAIFVCADTFYLFEVKNFTGDYYIHHDKIFSMKSKREIYDPFLQLGRSTYFFKSFLSSLGIKEEVESFVVFINDEFTLYQASPNLSMLLPTQVRRFLQKLYANARSVQRRHVEIAEMICARHKAQSSYERLPTYELDELRRGVFCPRCAIKMERKNRHRFICPRCDDTFCLEDAIIYATAEFCLLFPKNNITPKTIADWCGNSISERSVRRALQQHLHFHENGKHSFYYFPENEDHLKVLNRFRCYS